LIAWGGEDGQWLNEPIIPFYFFPSFALFPPPPQKKMGLNLNIVFHNMGWVAFKIKIAVSLYHITLFVYIT
jgi:hypothetical protein